MRTIVKPLFILALSVATAASAAAPGYHVTQRVPLGGTGGWDYLAVDGAARRLYVSRGTHVAVVDLKTDKQVGDIMDTPGVHGIALAPELGRGFISCGGAASALIFDLKTLKVLGQVKTGAGPDAIVYDPSSRRVFTFNGRGEDTTAFNAATGELAGTLPLGGKPEFAAADGKGKIYVNIENTSEVAEIDTAKLAVLRRFSIKPGEEPSGLALDAKRGLVFSGCRNKLMTVLDLHTGKVVTTVPIGAGVDGAGYDPATGDVFSSNGEGTLTVFRISGSLKPESVHTVPTQRGARTMAIDPETHGVYLPTAQFGPAPAPTAEDPHPRPAIVKDSFVVLVVGR